MVKLFGNDRTRQVASQLSSKIQNSTNAERENYPYDTFKTEYYEAQNQTQFKKNKQYTFEDRQKCIKFENQMTHLGLGSQVQLQRQNQVLHNIIINLERTNFQLQSQLQSQKQRLNKDQKNKNLLSPLTCKLQDSVDYPQFDVQKLIKQLNMVKNRQKQRQTSSKNILLPNGASEQQKQALILENQELQTKLVEATNKVLELEIQLQNKNDKLLKLINNTSEETKSRIRQNQKKHKLELTLRQLVQINIQKELQITELLKEKEYNKSKFATKIEVIENYQNPQNQEKQNELRLIYEKKINQLEKQLIKYNEIVSDYEVLKKNSQIKNQIDLNIDINFQQLNHQKQIVIAQKSQLQEESQLKSKILSDNNLKIKNLQETISQLKNQLAYHVELKNKHLNELQHVIRRQQQLRNNTTQFQRQLNLMALDNHNLKLDNSKLREEVNSLNNKFRQKDKKIKNELEDNDLYSMRQSSAKSYQKRWISNSKQTNQTEESNTKLFEQRINRLRRQNQQLKRTLYY